jgi:DNA-binding CsgD family transcriptional regulator
MLLGRDPELATLVDACRAASAGRGSTVVVGGEPGIGKTALLEGVARAAPAARVLWAVGVEAETSVAFATLHALLWPLRDALDELEAGQATLLRAILDLGPQPGTSTFAVGAAALSLLSTTSRDEPIVAVVDDAHWADAASQEALCFVGRRLERERVTLLAAVRLEEPSLFVEERVFARLELGGLDRDAARELLDLSVESPLAPDLAERLLEACAGSPLGLIELPRALTERQRRGEDPLPAAFEAGPLVQRAFATRAARLSDDAQRALLLLAAAGEADAPLLARLGVGPEAIDEAEASGLVVRGGRIDFRHPLMRAAVYGAAPRGRRREAHRELASALDGARRAWHLADAADGPDEAVAAALERAARDAAVAGGVAAQAQAFERAADLTPESDRRTVRLLEAARAWRLAGQMERVNEQLGRALALAATPRARAEVQFERGRALVRGRENEQAIDLLVEEADQVETLDRKLAARLLVEAAQAAEINPGAARTLELAERACSLAGADGDRAELAAVSMLLAARAKVNAPPDERDVDLVGRARELLERPELRAGAEEAHWISYCLSLHERDDEARRLSDRAMGEERASGDVWTLCYGLYARAAIEQATGRVDVAHSYALDALALAGEIGEAWRLSEAHGVLAEVEAARGDAAACERVLNTRREHVDESSFRRDWAWTWSLPLGVALVGAGRHEEAIPELEATLAFSRSDAVGPRAWYHLVPLELAEAYARAGRRRDAEALLLDDGPAIEWCRLSRPRAKLARVRGLLASEATIDTAFAAALTLLERTPHHLERARLSLNWGERLRETGRGADAVPRLEHALAAFNALGAGGWAERARRELEAAVGSPRPDRPRRIDALTPQELRVARHAAGGMRDREIAADLYLSPRTVESYLQSAYRKLGVSNRTQLAAVLASDGVQPAGEPARQMP